MGQLFQSLALQSLRQSAVSTIKNIPFQIVCALAIIAGTAGVGLALLGYRVMAWSIERIEGD